jgi:hypothetical protein
METWDQSSDIAVLTNEKLIVYRINKNASAFSIELVVTHTFTDPDAQSIIYDFIVGDIILAKNDRGYRVVFESGLTCHKNCNTCVRSFSANNLSCATNCATGSTFNLTTQMCAKDATPNPEGGYYLSYVGLAGTLIPVEIEKLTEEVDVEDDPNKIVKTNLSVIFIMFGSIFLLTMIILFGLVSPPLIRLNLLADLKRKSSQKVG